MGGRWLLRPSYCYNLKNVFHILQLKRKINYKIIFCGIKYTFTYWKKNYVKGTLFNRKDVIYGVTHPGFRERWYGIRKTSVVIRKLGSHFVKLPNLQKFFLWFWTNGWNCEKSRSRTNNYRDRSNRLMCPFRQLN